VPDPISSMSALGRARRPVVEPPPPKTRRHRSRLVLIALPIVAVFAGFGAVVWLAYQDGSYGSPIGEPPLVVADRSPIKLAPDDPGGGTIADQGQVRELLSETVPPQTMERLLPPEEEPLTPGQQAVDDATRMAELPGAETDTGDAATAPAAPEAVAETTAEGEVAMEAEVMAEPEAVPAPVTAERPDSEPTESSFSTTGTGGPVDDGRPPTGTPSEAEAALDALLAEVTQNSGRRPAPVETTTPAPAERDVATATAAPQQVRPAVTVSPAPPSTTGSGATSAGTSVADISPGERVGEIPARARSSPESGEPFTVVVPRIEEAPDANTALEGRFRVQLAAVRAEADARRAWDLFQVDLGPVLQGLQPYIERADTGNGTFYRVQVGSFAALVEAETLCEDLKQRNASCFVVRR
jgi:hypothetical protein